VLLDGQGAELPRAATLKDKHVALYFSAHWCPPCQRFTPELAETYKAIKAARDDFELVFVSGDRNAAQFRVQGVLCRVQGVLCHHAVACGAV
jgi:nucleoredoxin